MSVTKTKPRKPAYRTFTMAQIEEASAENAGFCIACGYCQDCCEPDARKYRCVGCDRNEVYGTEELMLMGLIKG